MNANENPDGDYMKVNNYLCEVAELRKDIIYGNNKNKYPQRSHY